MSTYHIECKLVKYLLIHIRVIWKYYTMMQFHIHNEIGSALLLNTNIQLGIHLLGKQKN